MGIEYRKDVARLAGFVSVEAAEQLLEWLQAHPKGQLDLADCEHLHAANLQVLLAARPMVATWPRDEALAGWLRNALTKD